MTLTQRRKLQAKNRREKARQKRLAQKQRQQARVQKRKEKRRIKAAPRLALAQWSREIRAGGKCEVCGRTDYLNAHHILPKEAYKHLKLHPLVGVCLCPLHHKYGPYSAHKNPIWFVLWLKINCPEKYEFAKQHVDDLR